MRALAVVMGLTWTLVGIHVLVMSQSGCSSTRQTDCARTALNPLVDQLQADPALVTPSDVLDAVHALRQCKAGADAGTVP